MTHGVKCASLPNDSSECTPNILASADYVARDRRDTGVGPVLGQRALRLLSAALAHRGSDRRHLHSNRLRRLHPLRTARRTQSSRSHKTEIFQIWSIMKSIT